MIVNLIPRPRMPQKLDGAIMLIPTMPIVRLLAPPPRQQPVQRQDLPMGIPHHPHL